MEWTPLPRRLCNERKFTKYWISFWWNQSRINTGWLFMDLFCMYCFVCKPNFQISPGNNGSFFHHLVGVPSWFEWTEWIRWFFNRYFVLHKGNVHLWYGQPSNWFGGNQMKFLASLLKLDCSTTCSMTKELFDKPHNALEIRIILCTVFANIAYCTNEYWSNMYLKSTFWSMNETVGMENIQQRGGDLRYCCYCSVSSCTCFSFDLCFVFSLLVWLFITIELLSLYKIIRN